MLCIATLLKIPTYLKHGLSILYIRATSRDITFSDLVSSSVSYVKGIYKHPKQLVGFFRGPHEPENCTKPFPTTTNSR